MKIDLLFPTPVCHTEIPLEACEKYAALVEEMLKVQPDSFGNPGLSDCTYDDLNTLDSFQELVKLVDERIQAYAEGYLGLEPDSLGMTCMWSNAHNSGNSHNVHNHANSYISGVVYLQVPKAGVTKRGTFFVIDPRAGNRQLYGNFLKPSPLSDRTWNYEPETGKMMIFPSWLEHGTDYFITEGPERRISLSFNYMLKRCGNNQMALPSTLTKTFDVKKL